jgi:TolA-binding protein
LRLSKKAIFIVLAGLILAGCANDQYAIEKKYWQIQKQAEKIFKNPHASPPRELERVVQVFNNFIQRYSQNRLATEAEFHIARLYMVKEEYEKARTQLQAIINKYNQAKLEPIRVEAVFLVGNSYEREDKWELALEQYKNIMQDYPTTIRGLDIPLYIAQHYKVKYQPDKMIAAYQEAVGYYNALAEKYPNSPLAYRAHTLVPACYVALKEWQNAIGALNTVIEKYKDKVTQDGTLIDIALIYKNELKDKMKAKEALEKLIKDYPQSKLIKTATAILKELAKNE